MTFDPDFDMPIEVEWLNLMRKVIKYNLELRLTKREEKDFIKIFIEVLENDDIIYENKGLEKNTDPFYQTVRFLKKYLKVEYL
jgi:hypothetical protein